MRRILVATALCIVPMVALGGYRVSSFKKETRLGANYWNAQAAVDGDFNSCWKIDPERENVGEWIEIDLPQGTIDKLAMVVGWDKDQETFEDYMRIKTVNVVVWDLAADDEDTPVLEQSVTFQDKRGWQILDLNDTPVGNDIAGGKMRITVAATHGEDTDFPSIAVSEVLVHLTETPAPSMVSSDPAPSDAAHPPGNLTDEDPRSFWLSADAGVGQTFTMEASGFGLSSLGIHAGPTVYSRPKKLKVTVNNQVLIKTLPDLEGWLYITLPSLSGYTGSAWGDVVVEIMEVYEGTKPGLGIAEVKLMATTYEGI